MLSPTEPTPEALAPYPAQDHAYIKEVWQQMQIAQQSGISKDLLRKAVLGDRQAQQQVEEQIEKAMPAGA